MYLLKFNDDGKPNLTRFIAGNIPRYAILSHTWEVDDQEVTFKDLTDGVGVSKLGYRKIRFCGEQARKDGLECFWVDSCCIDKSSSAELQEAINSMFRWYRDAARCYVYLSDVSTGQYSPSSQLQWQSAFNRSRWFTRGWTLQELLAPSSVEFFSREGKLLGDKKSLEVHLQNITGIAAPALQGKPLSEFGIDERMSWAAKRETTIQEDQAYCLLGLFDTYLPLIYGEGKENAFRRLRREIHGFNYDTLGRLPYAAEAPFNSNQRQHEPTCLPETRVDLLRTIYSWADGQDERTIFWLNGLAGTGKSTIARTIARRYFDLKRIGASFFFSRGGGDLGHAGKFVTTIALQLARSIPSLDQHICNALAEGRDIVTQSLRDQWYQLVLRPLSKLGESGGHSSYVLVVDALDECDNDDNIRIIIHLLGEVGSLKTVRLRVFLTSRPEIPIRYRFYQVPDTEYQHFVLHNISSSIVDHDISVFLKHNFKLIGQEHALDACWPGEEIVRRLIQIADGLFIWAATACRFVQEGLFADERVQILLEGSTSITAPEEHLNQLYTIVLKKSIRPSYSAQERAILYSMQRHILGSIVVLFSPLSASSLRKLLNIAKQKIDQVLKDLHAILDIPNADVCPLRLHHPSFRDFLLDHKRCEDPNFWVDEKQTHQILADGCIRLMSTSLKQDICGLDAPGVLVTDIERSRVEQSLPPEVQYACLYWPQHVEKSGSQLYDNGKVHCFLQEHLLHWLEALGWMGKVSEGFHAISSLESFASSSNCPGFSTFIHDAKRFVLSGRPVIEKAPLQTYCSALAFVPTTSIIRIQFEPCIPRWIRKLPRVEEKWKAVLQTLEGHSSPVTAVAFSPDGKTLVSASNDMTAKLWDAESGALLHTLKGHAGYLTAVIFSPDGKMLASASWDKMVKLWDTVSGALRHTLEGHSDHVNDVAFSLDGKTLASASASADKTVRVWDAGSGTLQQTLKGHSGSVDSVAFSPDADAKTLASASWDKTIKLWDTGSGALRYTLEGHTGYLTAMAFSPDGKTLASASGDKTVKLWDAGSGALRYTLEGHPGYLTAVAFSPDGKMLVSASWGKTVKLWDAGSGALRHTLEGYSNSSIYTLAVAFSPDGKTLASASDDKIKLWDAGSGALRQTLEGYSNSFTIVDAVAFSPDGKTLASTSNDSTVKLWDAGSGGAQQTLEGHSDSVTAVAFSPDGKTLASVSWDMTVKLWDAGSGALRQTLEGHAGHVTAVAFSPDGKTLASASGDKTVKLWDAGSGALRQTLEGHAESLTGVAFSPDCKTLASASRDKTAKLWDAGSGAVLQTLEGHLESVDAVAFSLDGKTLASASEDKTVKLWDAGSGAMRQSFEVYSKYINAVACSLDGKMLASASDGKTVRVWDAGSGTLQQTLHIGALVQTLSFSDGGTSLETNRGSFPISSSLYSSTANSSPQVLPLIFVNDEWVNCNTERILWLSPEYRLAKVAVHGSIVGLGCWSGRVTIMEFAPPRPPPFKVKSLYTSG